MQPIRTAHNEYKSYSNDVTYQYTETTTVSDAKRRFRVRQCQTTIGWFEKREWVDTNKRHDDLSRNKLFMFTSAVLLTFFIATVHNLGEVI